jgi:uncharacterized membrane protein
MSNQNHNIPFTILYEVVGVILVVAGFVFLVGGNMFGLDKEYTVIGILLLLLSVLLFYKSARNRREISVFSSSAEPSTKYSFVYIVISVLGMLAVCWHLVLLFEGWHLDLLKTLYWILVTTWAYRRGFLLKDDHKLLPVVVCFWSLGLILNNDPIADVVSIAVFGTITTASMIQFIKKNPRP